MDLSDRMGGAVHLVFPDEKKGGRSQIGETDFLPCSDRVYSGHCTLPSIGVRKVSGDEKAELQLERGALGSQPTEENLRFLLEIRNRKELHCLYLQELTAQKR